MYPWTGCFVWTQRREEWVIVQCGFVFCHYLWIPFVPETSNSGLTKGCGCNVPQVWQRRPARKPARHTLCSAALSHHYFRRQEFTGRISVPRKGRDQRGNGPGQMTKHVPTTRQPAKSNSLAEKKCFACTKLQEQYLNLHFCWKHHIVYFLHWLVKNWKFRTIHQPPASYLIVCKDRKLDLQGIL